MSFADQAVWVGTTGGSANAQTAVVPNVTSLADLLGVTINGIAGFTNTGPMTFSASGLSAAVMKVGSGGLVPLSGGEIVATNPVSFLNIGTSGYVIFGGGPIIQPVLVASATYFVNASTGSDSNNGLASGTAFATIQKAVNVAATFNLNGFNLTINVAAGTYGQTLCPQTNGSGTVILTGAGVSTTTLSATNHSAIAFNGPSSYKIAGFTVQSFGSGANDPISGLWVNPSANLNIGTMTYGNCAGSYIYCAGIGIMLASSVQTVSGTASNIGGFVSIAGGVLETPQTPLPTLVISTPVSVVNGFVFSELLSQTGLQFTSITNPSNVSGPRYLVSGNSVINSGGGGASYYPGSTSGSASSGGQYL